MTPKDLQQRTKNFALAIMKLSTILEKHSTGKFIGRQIFRSGTSTAANYRAACKSKSARDFIAKLGIVIEESDETAFWLELIQESKIIQNDSLQDMLKEANEIVAIMTASKNSTIKNQRSKYSWSISMFNLGQSWSIILGHDSFTQLGGAERFFLKDNMKKDIYRK